MQNTTSQKFFLYARKSTDVEDKQILSIEAQIAELRTFAKQNNLNIIEELVEKQSAKIPGRPIFNEMIKRIEKGEVNGRFKVLLHHFVNIWQPPHSELDNSMIFLDDYSVSLVSRKSPHLTL